MDHYWYYNKKLYYYIEYIAPPIEYVASRGGEQVPNFRSSDHESYQMLSPVLEKCTRVSYP